MPSQVPTTHSQVRSGQVRSEVRRGTCLHDAKLKKYSQLGRILTVGAIALTLLYFASRSLNLFVEILTHFQI